MSTFQNDDIIFIEKKNSDLWSKNKNNFRVASFHLNVELLCK